VPAADLMPLPDATFYRHDLIGCDVETVGGSPVGTVAAVEGTLEMSRLVVRSARGEVLVPLVAGICVLVDPAARKIVIDPPEGLLDLNI
ncbi:MAG TPA: PRC-barrel domain-containing protein, partial [Vicinamibacterales bacterium]|nr:PRC-barrel domain-containing protein [Vicinamibacterales bacterium]